MNSAPHAPHSAMLPPGYKQTEVGIIPEKWDVASFGNVLRRLNAKENQIQTAEYQPSGAFPVIDQGQTAVVGFTDKAEKVFRCPTDGVVVFGDHTCIVKYVAFDFVVGADGTQLLTAKPEHCARFHAFALQHRGIQTTGYNRHFKFLKERSFMCPPEAEQRAIAEALSDVDGLLGGLDRLIAKKRDLKQAAMQELLTGQTRLPGFGKEKARFHQTEVGVIPDDWQLIRLVDLVDASRGIRYGIVQPGNYDPQGRYMIRGQDYSEAKGWANPADVFRVSPSIEERYRNSRVKTGDLIMTIVGYCGHVEMIPDWLDGANLTQTTARIAIQPNKAVSAFCKYLLLSPSGRNQVAAYLKGAAQPGLNCGDVEKFLIPIPLLPEQTAIAEVLTEMDAELTALEQRREKTRALKQAMMQELLTGKTRLVPSQEAHA